jgi:hypothetical protein
MALVGIELEIVSHPPMKQIFYFIQHFDANENNQKYDYFYVG